MVASGHAPEGLIGAAGRALRTGSPMGLQWKTLDVQIKHVEGSSGLQVPVDKDGGGLSGPALLHGDHQLPRVPRGHHQDLRPRGGELDAEQGLLRGDQRRHPDRLEGYRRRTGGARGQRRGQAQGQERHQPGVRPRLYRHPLGGAQPDRTRLPLPRLPHHRGPGPVARLRPPEDRGDGDGPPEHARPVQPGPQERLHPAAAQPHGPGGGELRRSQGTRSLPVVLRGRRRGQQQRAGRAPQDGRLQAQEGPDRGGRARAHGHHVCHLPDPARRGPGGLQHGHPGGRT